MLIKWVGIGDVKLASSGEMLATVLGSCVSVVLWHPQRRIAVMSHVLLAGPPSPSRPGGDPGRFADSSWKLLRRLLAEQGISAEQCQCHVAGGSNMFRQEGPAVGRHNLQRVFDILESADIAVLSRDVGGHQHRLVKFNPATGQMKISVPSRIEPTLPDPSDAWSMLTPTNGHYAPMTPGVKK